MKQLPEPVDAETNFYVKDYGLRLEACFAWRKYRWTAHKIRATTQEGGKDLHNALLRQFWRHLGAA